MNNDEKRRDGRSPKRVVIDTAIGLTLITLSWWLLIEGVIPRVAAIMRRWM